MNTLLDGVDIDELNTLAPEALLAWAAGTSGPRAAIVTSFQNTGCVLIDMSRRMAPGLRVVTIDTRRLFKETYALMDVIEQRYDLTIERFTPNPARLEAMMAEHGEYLFFDSREKQRLCCQVRKVEPNQRALDTLDVWITGLRRDQSSFRENTARASIVKQNGRKLIKLSPLADWSEQELWDYIKAHDVPYNSLLDRGYTSIGCEICSTPTRPCEDKRAGRWRWFNSLAAGQPKECGIHTQGGGI